MTPKSETQASQASRLDTFKLTGAITLVLAAVVAFHYFADHSQLLRVLGLLAAAAGAVAIAATTELGATVWEFSKDARMELRKVVWPTRQETLQTSLAVILMVVVMGVLLWLLDILLLWIVRLLTGHG
jgi:preprotein translocase subunit SecE